MAKGKAGRGRLALAIFAAVACAALAAGCGGGGSSSASSSTSPPGKTAEAEPPENESEAESLQAELEAEIPPLGAEEVEEPEAREPQAPIQGLEDVAARLEGLRQSQLTLGDPHAPVEVDEYGDLQCPICREWAETRLPALIQGPVAEGKAKLVFRNFLIIGPQSKAAGMAALAAGEQGRGWQFIELFFRNQGTENSGYATGRFLAEIAQVAGVRDLARWDREREKPAFAREVEASTAEATRLKFSGTPTFTLTGPKTHGRELLGTPRSGAALLQAIKKAASASR